MEDARIAQLITCYPLISKQINPAQLTSILRELQYALAASSAGAVVEFGCYIGTTSLFIRRLLDMVDENRPFHVYDSFQGLPPKSTQDASPAGSQFRAGELAASKKQFVHEFQKARLVPPLIHKGWFAEMTPTDVPASIAFAFLDGDFYESIRDSLRLVLPRLTNHATVVIDDYAREALPGAARALRDVAPHLADHVRIEHNLGILRL